MTGAGCFGGENSSDDRIRTTYFMKNRGGGGRIMANFNAKKYCGKAILKNSPLQHALAPVDPWKK